MVVSCDYVVDGVRSGLFAEMADALVSFEDDEASCCPIFRESRFASCWLPCSLMLFASSELFSVAGASRFETWCRSEH